MKLEDIRQLCKDLKRWEPGQFSIREVIIPALLDIAEAAQKLQDNRPGFYGECDPDSMDGLEEALNKLEEL